MCCEDLYEFLLSFFFFFFLFLELSASKCFMCFTQSQIYSRVADIVLLFAFTFILNIFFSKRFLGNKKCSHVSHLMVCVQTLKDARTEMKIRVKKKQMKFTFIANFILDSLLNQKHFIFMLLTK